MSTPRTSPMRSASLRLAVALATGLAALIGCVDPPNGPLDGTPTHAVALDPLEAAVLVADRATLHAFAISADGDVLLGRKFTWESAHPAIARVDAAGVVTGVAPGRATIRATNSGKTASATIEVRRYADGPQQRYLLRLNPADGAGLPVVGTRTWTDENGAAHPATLVISAGELKTVADHGTWVQRLTVDVIVAGRGTVDQETWILSGSLNLNFPGDTWFFTPTSGAGGESFAGKQGPGEFRLQQRIGSAAPASYLWVVE